MTSSGAPTEKILVLGRKHFADGDLTAALAAFDRAVCEDAFSAEAYCARAELLEKQCAFRQAICDYERSLDLKRRCLPARLGLSRCLLRCGQHSQAAEGFQQVLAVEPENLTALLGCAHAFRHLGKTAQAIELYEDILRLDPSHDSARLILDSLNSESSPEHLPRKAVAKLFDDYAEGYDAHMTGALRYETPHRLAEAVTAAAGAGPHRWRVLDLGCGTGLCGPHFREHASWLSGVDLSPSMIEKAKALSLYDDLKTGDLTEALTNDCEPFDVILAADVFVYIGDLSAVFRGCAAALSSGGLFAFTTEISDEQDFCLQKTLRFAHSRGYCENLAREQGLELAHCERFTARYHQGAPCWQNLFVLRRH